MPTFVYKTADGKRVPSVTTILGNCGWSKDGIAWWANAQGLEGRTLQEARVKVTTPGTLAHEMASCDITGKGLPDLSDYDPDTREKALASFASYRSWRRMTRLELVASEVPLISEALRFGGCLDAVAVFDGSPAILDFKSAKALYGDHVIQVAAYSRLWAEANPDLVPTHWHILRWSEEGGFHHDALTAAQVKAGWEAFEHLLAIHNLKKKVAA